MGRILSRPSLNRRMQTGYDHASFGKTYGKCRDRSDTTGPDSGGDQVVHTIIWAFFVCCIVTIPVMGALRWFRAAWILSAIVMVECLALAVTRGRCPLTPVAARFTADRHLGFDICLPAWVARWNKELFGAIYVAGMLFVLWAQFR